MANVLLARRRLIVAATVLALPGRLVFGSEGQRLPATPSDHEGPFYPVDIPEDSDNDLLNVMGHGAPASGQPTYLFGRVMDRDGQRIDGARVEVWQCDGNGVYHHPGDPGNPDLNFQGFGAMVTDRDGAYHFRTLRPVPYDGRTPHIHFRVTASEFDRLTTQLYVSEEADRNRRDALYRDHGAAERSLITASFQPMAGDSNLLTAEFNIVLG